MPLPRYVLDTHFYVEILRGTDGGVALRQLLAEHLDAVDFHAVVGAELLFGARDAAMATTIRHRVIDGYRPNRLIAPDAPDIFAAGDAIRTLRDARDEHPELGRRDFWNDVLIAVTCRRRGRVLVSQDEDHARIARVVKHRVLKSLPSPPVRRRSST